MNRRERRARKAHRSRIPPLYRLTCERMIDALHAWLSEHPNDEPRFALPPGGPLFVAGEIHHVRPGSIAKNAAAAALVVRFCELGVAIQEGGQPSIEMLRVVLEVVGLPYETRPLGEFGTFAPLTRGGEG